MLHRIAVLRPANLTCYHTLFAGVSGHVAVGELGTVVLVLLEKPDRAPEGDMGYGRLGSLCICMSLF